MLTWPSRRNLVLTWLAFAVGIGLLLVLAEAAEGPLDDADPAYQRPGILDLGGLPVPAPKVTDELPAPDRAAVVFFVRPDQLGPLCDVLTGVELARQPDLAVVVAGPLGPCAAEAVAVTDPGARLSDGYGLRSPQGGGAPVGYAVVDRAGMIRYRTLDPEVDDLLDEVDTILRAT
jgi:hypothetical protein